MRVKQTLTERHCTRCGQLLSMDQFYRQGNGYQQPCKECRKNLTVEQRRRRMEADRQRHVRERQAQSNLYTGEANGFCYTVVSDPDPEYGYRPGAKFQSIQVSFMLVLGSFTPGTVLLNPRRKALQVIGSEKQRLIEVAR